MLDALILSDIHLGAEICCAKQVTEFLEKIEDGTIATQKIILNGDVFDSHDFRRLKKTHWKILSILRKLSDHIEIVWVAGNHDGPAEVISHLLGVNVVNEYMFRSGDERILLLHGHIYDDFISNYPILTWIADVLYGIFQKLDRSHNLCRWLKQQSKSYLRCTEEVEKKAVKYARKQNASIVCCGHVHKPECSHHDKVTYFNSGCWTESPCTYLSVINGQVTLHQWEQS